MTTAPYRASRPGMTAAFIRGEVRRTLRNRRYMIFTIVTPLLLFLLIGFAGGDTKIDKITYLEYIMVSMATFGTLSAVFSRGGAIAQERSTGWNRQLRLTALTGRQYVAGKIATGFVTAVPALVVVLGVGAAHGVDLPAIRWLTISISILLAL
ncbi:MAG: ABC transporter permease, partial [Frankia sp.]